MTLCTKGLAGHVTKALGNYTYVPFQEELCPVTELPLLLTASNQK